MNKTQIVKICIVGTESVGKTNIRRILIGKRFKRNVSPTIGSDFSFKEVYLNETIIKSMIWDLSGNDKYKNSRGLYLQGIQGAFLVFDITNESSFLRLEEWVKDIQQSTVNRGGIPLHILANKSDLIPFSDYEISEQQIIEFTNSIREQFHLKFNVNFSIISASTGENIEDAYFKLLTDIQNWVGNRNFK